VTCDDVVIAIAAAAHLRRAILLYCSSRTVAASLALLLLHAAPKTHSRLDYESYPICGWLGSRVVSMLESGAEGLGSNRDAVW